MTLWETFQHSRFKASGRGNLLDVYCQGSGLEIEERHGDSIVLHVKGSDRIPPRAVCVSHWEREQLVRFSCDCHGVFSEETIPDGFMGYLMAYNAEMPMGGFAAIIEDRAIRFSLHYAALVDGVDASIFREICRALARLVTAAEVDFRRDGLR